MKIIKDKNNSEKKERDDINWEVADDKYSFIQLYNDFTNYNNDKLFLSPEELYIYSVVNIHETTRNITRLNLHLIERSLPVSFGEYGTHGRNRAKSILTNLQSRGILIIKEDLNKKKFSPIETINIKINREFILENSIKDGFEKIPVTSFFSAESMYDFYIYCCVHKGYHHKITCTYENWAKLLNCSIRHAIRRIDIAVENTAIFRKIGNHISINEQEPNEYSTISFKNDINENKSRKTRKKS